MTTQRFKLGEHDVEVIFREAENRIQSTPSIYDLDNFLDKLKRKYPIECFATRRYLKWLMKKCHKELGVEMHNPYWKPRRSRY